MGLHFSEKNKKGSSNFSGHLNSIDPVIFIGKKVKNICFSSPSA